MKLCKSNPFTNLHLKENFGDVLPLKINWLKGIIKMPPKNKTNFLKLILKIKL